MMLILRQVRFSKGQESLGGLVPRRDMAQQGQSPGGCNSVWVQYNETFDIIGNPTVPRKIADALLNPVDAIKKPIDYLINKGQELANSVSGMYIILIWINILKYQNFLILMLQTFLLMCRIRSGEFLRIFTQTVDGLFQIRLFKGKSSALQSYKSFHNDNIHKKKQEITGNNMATDLIPAMGCHKPAMACHKPAMASRKPATACLATAVHQTATEHLQTVITARTMDLELLTVITRPLIMQVRFQTPLSNLQGGQN